MAEQTWRTSSAQLLRAGRTGMLDQTWMCAFWSSNLVHRALLVAIPNGVFAALLSAYLPMYFGDKGFDVLGVSQVWSGYNFVLGFLVVFRTQHAYARFWEGATLLQEVRGEWFNAVSSVFAFCTGSPERRLEVEEFQNLIVRLMSMLHCAALEQVSVGALKDFATLDTDSIDPGALRYLKRKRDKCEVIMQWVQRLIVENQGSGVINIAPPILSRVFQELSRGIVKCNSAKKITDIPFPRPYAHLIRLMLAIQWVVTPMVCSMLLQNWTLSAGLSMITIFAFTSTVHIASEIENPFGDDPNDLPLIEFQNNFNLSLLTLLDARTQQPPQYVHKRIGALSTSLSSGFDWLSPEESVAHAQSNASRGSMPTPARALSHARIPEASIPKDPGAEREAKLEMSLQQSTASVGTRHEEKHEAKAGAAGSSGESLRTSAPATPPESARRHESPSSRDVAGVPPGLQAEDGAAWPGPSGDAPGDPAGSLAAEGGNTRGFLVEVGDMPPQSAASFGIKCSSPPQSPVIASGR